MKFDRIVPQNYQLRVCVSFNCQDNSPTLELALDDSHANNMFHPSCRIIISYAFIAVILVRHETLDKT